MDGPLDRFVKLNVLHRVASILLAGVDLVDRRGIPCCILVDLGRVQLVVLVVPTSEMFRSSR